MVTDISKDKTELGNYFIANYPPFAHWKRDHLPTIEQTLDSPPKEEVPLGLYLHIPFCRKRCKFCYFRVYTDVNAKVIQDYVDALGDEIAMIAERPAVAGRTIGYVYFGGGTPSYLSAKQLDGLVAKLRKSVTWDQAQEVTFECEPGTLQESKLETLKAIGVTRLSLGVENFDPAILEENGRAHQTKEIYRAWEWIQKIGFEQVNIDLIAGMVGETWENWRENIRKTIEISPDAVTIYQMELPYNTRYSEQLTVLGQPVAVANWSLKRDWVEYAFATLEEAGYTASSGYTLLKKRPDRPVKFLYRDNLWHGADLLASGVASFGHLQGIHYQNIDTLEKYQAMVAEGKLPLGRALPVTQEERLIRELILQMKLGWLDAGYFRQKFGVEIFTHFGPQFRQIVADELGDIAGDRFTLRREGLLRVDSLLPPFFQPEHRTERYA